MGKKGIMLDVILPVSFDITPDGNIIKEYEDVEGYILNEECTLQIMFTPNNTIEIEYYSDADTYVLEEMFPDLNTECTPETFVSKQYEIASLINLKTVDI